MDTLFKRIVFVVAVASCFSRLASGAPVVEAAGSALVIRNITPGSSVALLGVAREPAYYMAHMVVRRELLADEDRDGTVQYPLPNGVAFQSIWIAIDVASGETTTFSPDGYVPLEMHERGAGRSKSVEAIENTLDIGRAVVELVVVRPGHGAWFATPRDGGAADRNGRDRNIRLDPAKMKARGGTHGDAPHALQNGDVVAVIDPEMMEYWIRVIGRGRE
jgi:hypothetical protein